MRRDLGKHRRWLVIDALLLAVSVPLTLIPGPNVPALYFSFRVVGHFLSMRGASACARPSSPGTACRRLT